MADPITIESFEVAGFRAYLKPQTFPLGTKKHCKSLVVYAPNATGKSSLIDAFEFFFSENGSLERLGKRVSPTQAGPKAMEHVSAKSKRVPGRVSFKFRQGKERFENDRFLANSGERPGAAQRVADAIKLPFVIRGYDLRKFVMDSALDRYVEMGAWFALDPILNIQQSLQALRRSIRTKSETSGQIDGRLLDLRNQTDEKVTEWDETKVCEWFNSNVLASLDPELSLESLSETDPTFIAIVEAEKKEQEHLGLAAINRLITDVKAIQGEDDEKGLIGVFETSVNSFDEAIRRKSEERNVASQAIFNDIWENANSLFNNQDIQMESCPVCDTKFEDTPHGSCDGVKVSVQTQLSTLSKYRAAEKAADRAAKDAQDSNRKLITAIDKLRTGLNEGGFTVGEEIPDYLTKVETWSLNDPTPNPVDIISKLKKTNSSLKNTKSAIILKQGDNTYAIACDHARRLIRLKADVEAILRTKKHLGTLLDGLTSQTEIVEDQINRHVLSLLSGLESEVNRLYLKMQRPVDPDPSPIKFWLSPDRSKNQRQVRLAIDFAPNQKEVAPTGYLSDSQIHSVAIALRLAAIRAFNRNAPIIVLDDVVTSYDADHRKNIAATIAEELDGFQVVLVTHDEQFFLLLKDHLSESEFEFQRITQIDPDFGPVFSNYRTPDEVIDNKLSQRQSAGEEIRKVEEEWLLKICREFVVDVAIRPIDQPFHFNRSELASALSSFLNEKRILPPKIAGFRNGFLTSLQTGVVENFASHFSDNPNRSGSFGDEKARWDEFREFRGLFRCSKCGHSRFKRPHTIKNPLCNKCDTPFEFPDSAH